MTPDALKQLLDDWEARMEAREMDTRRMKYVCPACEAEAWARPGTSLTCNTCVETMRADKPAIWEASGAGRPTHVQHWPEWRVVRAAEQRCGPPYVAALAHWATWRGRWLKARTRGDFARMIEAELKAERHARTMRNALRWHGAEEPEVAATMAAHRRITDEVMRAPLRSFPDMPLPQPVAEMAREWKADRRRRWTRTGQGGP